MVKVLGRMEEGAAPVASSGAEVVNRGFRVLGRMGEATGEAVATTSNAIVGAVSDGVDAATGFVANAAQTPGLENRPGFRPQSAEEAMGNFKELMSGAADAVTPDPETMVKGLLFASPVASNLLPINAAKFAEFLGNEGDIEMSTEELGDDADFLREAAIQAIQSGENKFTYETWGFEDKTILMSDLATTAVKSFTDPNYRMATLIGRTGDNNVRVEDGRIIVEDVYDFNSGPRGRKLQEALALKEAGDEAGYESLAEEALADLPYFGQMRVWAAALGVPQGEGTRYKLDLGPAPEELSEEDQ